METEKFGMTVAEATGSGKTVIASSLAGPTEIITDGVDGLLVPAGNARAVADATARLLNDHDLQRFLAHNTMIRSHDFSMDAFIKRIDDVLGEVIYV